MGMLRDGDTESARIVAALALTRIGDARGVYACSAPRSSTTAGTCRPCAHGFTSSTPKAGLSPPRSSETETDACSRSPLTSSGLNDASQRRPPHRPSAG